jgi:hypothetical protein
MMLKWTDAQVRMLKAILTHGDPVHGLHGRSAHGGAQATLGSLIRRGHVKRDQGRFVIVTLEAMDAAKGRT